MYSSDEINACMTEEELFKLWKTKDVYNAINANLKVSHF